MTESSGDYASQCSTTMLWVYMSTQSHPWGLLAKLGLGLQAGEELGNKRRMDAETHPPSVRNSTGEANGRMFPGRSVRFAGLLKTNRLMSRGRCLKG